MFYNVSGDLLPLLFFFPKHGSRPFHPTYTLTPGVPSYVHVALWWLWLVPAFGSATRLSSFWFLCFILLFSWHAKCIYLLQVMAFAVNIQRNDVCVWELKPGILMNKSLTVHRCGVYAVCVCVCARASFHTYHDVRYRCFWLQALLWIIP